MKILFVNHTGLVGGGERSLLALLASLPGDVQPRLACPPGPLAQSATEIGITTTPIAESVVSLKLHPVHTPLALATMAGAVAGVRRATSEWQPDALHANSIRAGLIALPVARGAGRPLILHVRDCLPRSAVTERLQGFLALRSAAIIAISRYVARSFDPFGTAPHLEVIANPFDLDRLNPAKLDRGRARAQLGIADGVSVLGLIGQLTPWKGQEDAIRALAEVLRRHPQTLLLLVGEAKFVARATRFDNRGYRRQLHDLVRELGLSEQTRFLGEREDVPEILRACDVALTPSWEEPFGRAVVEAMAVGCPVVATSVGGPAEIIEDGHNGVLVPPREPARLADAIDGLLSDESRRRAMAQAALETAADFGQARHACRVAELYREVIEAAVPVR